MSNPTTAPALPQPRGCSRELSRKDGDMGPAALAAALGQPLPQLFRGQIQPGSCLIRSSSSGPCLIRSSSSSPCLIRPMPKRKGFQSPAYSLSTLPDTMLAPGQGRDPAAAWQCPLPYPSQPGGQGTG